MASGIPVTNVADGINTSMVLDNKIRTAPVPYGHLIAEGVIPNHTGFVKFGANADVGTTEELIWPLSNGRTYLTAAETLQVKSSDANDTAAGTGARTVLLTGQTTDYVEVTETVTLNGVSSVETTNSFLRIYRVAVVTAGSGGTNAGNITINDNADVNALAYIAAGRGQSEMAFITIPAGSTGYIPEIWAGENANKKVSVRLYARDNAVTDAAWQLKAEIVVNLSDTTRSFFIPLKFTEKTDIKLVAVASVTGGDVIAGFTMYYEQ